jgi:N-acetyl-gamma-glutamyl-phosphate reductase
MSAHYAGQHFVKVMELGGKDTLPDGFLPANTLAGTNNMQIFVCGNDEQILLCSRLDNLGKGASGAAVQCMNIMLGIDETTGLE